MQCLKCGDCCRIFSTVLLTDTEVESELYLTASRKVDKDVRLRKNTNGNCIYLQDNRCTIHPIKPMVCKNGKCPKGTGDLEFPKALKEV